MALMCVIIIVLNDLHTVLINMRLLIDNKRQRLIDGERMVRCHPPPFIIPPFSPTPPLFPLHVLSLHVSLR